MWEAEQTEIPFFYGIFKANVMYDAKLTFTPFNVTEPGASANRVMSFLNFIVFIHILMKLRLLRNTNKWTKTINLLSLWRLFLCNAKKPQP